MSDNSSTIISKVWGMCDPLRDDGVSYGDYLEQLTYLIFLKMSDEYTKPPYKKETGIPKVSVKLPAFTADSFSAILKKTHKTNSFLKEANYHGQDYT